VGWLAAGRSEATIARAEKLTAFATMAEIVEWAQVIVSVCPPNAAVEQARAVIAAGFKGLYVDANAVAPDTALQISEIVGPPYVDGGIIGPPAEVAGTTRLYLSGPQASNVAFLFGDAALEAIVLGQDTTQASALKMAYAAYTKGSSALLLAVNALARSTGVQDALQREWDISQPGLVKRSQGAAKGTSRKAWRFVGEMEEIADTFAAVGLPSDFHIAAADIYARMAHLKDEPPAELECVLQSIVEETSRGKSD
jgi:3-hydroxyisobutyrate dehydrogenase-like beta-hydroxyacid dehydrogenase